MRKAAALAALALAALSCGGGEEKAAFERYEKAVGPSLTAEAELRARFGEKVLDVNSYGGDKELADLVDRKMVPFYSEMEKAVAAVVPEGGRLTELHALLLRYVALQKDLFSSYRLLDTRLRAAAEAEQPIRERLQSAEGTRNEAAKALNSAVTTSPESRNALAGLFRQEAAAADQVYKRLAALEQGEVGAADYLALLDGEIAPFYESLLAAVDALDIPVTVKLAAKAYAGTMGPFIAASREFAALRATAEKDIDPLRDRMGQARDDATAALEQYTSGAKAYRDSLR